MNTKVKLTPDLAQKIVASIRAGGFPHVAAEAWGVPAELFRKWLQYAKNNQRKKHYVQFYEQVQQAQAQARLKAEMDMLAEDPRFWLKSGPGKETAEKPGWTAVVKPILQADNRSINFFGSQEFMNFLTTIRAVLAPHPEALKALTSALDGSPQPAQPLPQAEEKVIPQ